MVSAVFKGSVRGCRRMAFCISQVQQEADGHVTSVMWGGSIQRGGQRVGKPQGVVKYPGSWNIWAPLPLQAWRGEERGWLQESREEERSEIGLTDRSCELQLRDAARTTVAIYTYILKLSRSDWKTRQGRALREGRRREGLGFVNRMVRKGLTKKVASKQNLKEVYL